ncbi:hypothetical protein HY285_04515 [Candidatus Peregrinibacteria bacterium]|nr:hypothetical protein [Candidatus Peregrinibacteria bacterium]MBI3816777.1 hypothetical protein [Candidatus Peregrinibacteria bacterium]
MGFRRRSKQQGKDGSSRILEVTFQQYDDSIARDHAIMRVMEEALRKEAKQ